MHSKSVWFNLTLPLSRGQVCPAGEIEKGTGSASPIESYSCSSKAVCINDLRHKGSNVPAKWPVNRRHVAKCRHLSSEFNNRSLQQVEWMARKMGLPTTPFLNSTAECPCGCKIAQFHLNSNIRSSDHFMDKKQWGSFEKFVFTKSKTNPWQQRSNKSTSEIRTNISFLTLV